MNDTPRPSALLARAAKQGALSLLVLSIILTSATAQEVAYSPPVGGMAISVAAGTPTAPFTTTFSVPIYDVPAATGITTGVISGVTATTVTVANAGWTSGALVLPGFPYAVRFLSGQSEGLTLTITANTSDTLSVTGVNLSTLNVAAGDRFTVFPIDTLNTLFGSSTLLGGATPADADIVTLSGTLEISYYYSTSRNSWLRTSGPTTDRGATPILPHTAVSITRKSGSVPLVFLGQVPTSRAMISVANSGSTYTNTGFPTAVTLGTLAVQSKIAGWVSSATPTSADLVGINSGGIWSYYFHNGANWQRTSGPATNRDSVSIPAGAAIQIFRVGIAGGNTYLLRNTPFTL
jgi:hypothetical protein